ncbi:zeta toxin family protein [Candidatus Woesearchaeota archaeon]|nr:zeta toxin family protein [Candidatus Woesearchaeota archaeon]
MGLIPEETIQGWRDQYRQGPLVDRYGEEEISRIEKLVNEDRKFVRMMAFKDARHVKDRKPVYVATAGPPLAAKSTILSQQIKDNPARYDATVKVDPDRWGMLFMLHTYHNHLMDPAEVAKSADFRGAQVKAYELARPGSNILAFEILNDAVERLLDIAHGTTSTGTHAGDLLNALKQRGYEIDLLLCNAEDDIRAKAAEYRANVQGYYQSTPEDVVNKGLAFPRKFPEYFRVADNLTLFWKYGVTDQAKKAAIFTQGALEITDEQAFRRFVAKYEKDCLVIQEREKIHLPTFEEITRLYFSK